MTADDETRRDSWSREQDRAFENALWEYPEDSLDRWEKIASQVEGKSVDEIKHHYELLVDDVSRIESGHVPIPCYSSSSVDGSICDEGNTSKKGGSDSKGLKSEQERRKGIAWTEEEHKNFLLGLEEYGKGDWRSISRNSVVTRTPTQVASHAQKYFIRLNSLNKDRRRSSIHDITSVNGGDDVSVPKGPITGEINGSSSSSAAGGSSSKKNISQSIGGPHGSEVGTPAHMGYGVRGSVAGQVVSGKPMSVGPRAYHTAAHRSR